MHIIDQQLELSLKNKCVQFMFAYQQKDVDKMISFCDPYGTVAFLPLGAAGQGKIGELGRAIWQSLVDCFPNIDNTLDAAVAEDHRAVRCQVVIRGTQKKDFANIKSKGNSFDSDHIFIFHINDDNMIDQITVEWNHEDFVRQLSA